MRLATISPRVIEQVINGGDLPPTLSATRAEDHSAVWEEQEQEFLAE